MNEIKSDFRCSCSCTIGGIQTTVGLFVRILIFVTALLLSQFTTESWSALVSIYASTAFNGMRVASSETCSTGTIGVRETEGIDDSSIWTFSQYNGLKEGCKRNPNMETHEIGRSG